MAINRDKILKILNYPSASMEVRPDSAKYPLAVRTYGESVPIMFGVPLQSNPFQGWEFFSDKFWTKLYNQRFSFWVVTKTAGKWVGQSFDPKNIISHIDPEMKAYPIWICRKWLIRPAQSLPDRIVETLSLISQKVGLPNNMLVEITGNRIYDIHEVPDFLKQVEIDKFKYLRLSWNFERQQPEEEGWEQLNSKTRNSIAPQQFKFD